MSDAWIAVGSALVGALVGGAFVAVVAWFQARSAYKLTELQLQASYDSQKELLRWQQTCRAVQEITAALADVAAFFLKVGNQHHHPSGRNTCTIEDLSPNMLTIGAKLARVEQLYGPFLPVAARAELVETVELVDLGENGWAKLIADTLTESNCTFSGQSNCIVLACDVTTSRLQKVAGAPASLADLDAYIRATERNA